MTQNNASEYFNANWKKYKDSVNNNMLYHREMFETINDCLNAYKNRPFTFLDLGCGDCSFIAPVLQNKQVTQYFGVDAAPGVIELGKMSMKNVHCPQEFIVEDMIQALKSLNRTVDVIFTSYAVHHLSLEQKEDFLKTCQERLNPTGYLLMLDGVRYEGQTREKWLQVLEKRMQLANQGILEQELAERMRHPISDDHPEPVSFFKEVAIKQAWKHFEILRQHEIFALMLFVKE